MRTSGGMLPVAVLSNQRWVKGLPGDMSATEMDKAHRVTMGISGYLQPIAGTVLK